MSDRTKSITNENGAELTKAAAADAATILGIFKGHAQRMNKVYETLKARLTGKTEAEVTYYVPKLKAALKAEGFNPGTLGRIFAAVKWANESGIPFDTWATYMGKQGLDAAYEAHKAATRAAHQTGRTEKGEGTTEDEGDTVDGIDAAPANTAKAAKPFDAIISLLDRLTEDELVTLGLVIESRLDAKADMPELEAEAA